jgi:L-iditol 2-dehydrogenase
MRAAVFHGVGDLRLDAREVPQIGDEEALLRVRAASICATDLKILTSGHFRIADGATRVLGHEFAGEITAVGANVSELRVGMRVALAPNVGDGTCEQCVRGNNHLCPNYEAFGITVDGALAEFMRLPARAIRQGNILEVPADLSFEEAALNEPLSCCYNGYTSLNPQVGEIVLIIGAGPIGLMHLMLARAGGASKVIVSEMDAPRAAQAREFGADLVANPAEEDLLTRVSDETQGHRADIVIVAAPSAQAQQEALELAAVKGRINFFGGLPKGKENIWFNSNLVHYRQLTVTGTTGSSIRQYRRTMNLLAARRLDVRPFVSARYSLDDVLIAFERARSRHALKVVVEP